MTDWNSALYMKFENERTRAARAYPKQPDGKVLLRYPRLFFVAQK